MRLFLEDIKEFVSDKDLKDDALDLWLQIKNENKKKAAVAAFYSRHNIKVGDRYFYTVFVDGDTGEMLEMNCSFLLHKAMVKYKLYPQFILNGLNRNYGNNSY